MISKEDEEYLNNPDYNMQFETIIFPNYYNSVRNSHNAEDSPTEMIYKSSNEQLDVMFRRDIDVKDKRIATVGSSGDQILNALFYGSKDVTLIDANILSRAFTEYKIAAIKTFPFEDYNQLFNNDELFCWWNYRKLSHLLSDQSKIFWDNIILEQNVENMYRNKYKLIDIFIGDMDFRKYFYHGSGISHSRFSVNTDDYKKLQDILINGDFNINYITAEFADFADALNGEYDIILLSNIYDYVNLDTYLNVVSDLYYTHLSDNGTIQINYDFGYDNACGDFSQIIKIELGKYLNGGIHTPKFFSHGCHHYVTKEPILEFASLELSSDETEKMCAII